MSNNSKQAVKFIIWVTAILALVVTMSSCDNNQKSQAQDPTIARLNSYLAEQKRKNQIESERQMQMAGVVATAVLGAVADSYNNSNADRRTQHDGGWFQDPSERVRYYDRNGFEHQGSYQEARKAVYGY